MSDISVILLTPQSEPQDIFSVLDCGANNFVTKPYDEHLLYGKNQNHVFESGT
jgi:DNA-binding response OmpR family regulator